MASEIKANKISPATGTDLTIGDSGDTVSIAANISGNLTVDTDTLHVDSTNNRVGIGTSSPVSMLQVGDETTSNTLITVESANNTLAGIDLMGDLSGSKGFRIKYEGNGNYFAIEDNTSSVLTERMRITSGGGVNVGSGVLSAASSDGDIVADLGVVIGTYNGDNRIAASSLGGGSATLYIGNAAIQVSSDERLKTNIADTTMSAVDKIKQVRIVDFNWNDPSDTSYNNRNARGTWTGVIAQELIDVFPFAVNAPRKEEDLSIDIESEKKWQVDQAHLVPVLMKAIQEQQAIIEDLQTRLSALEAN